MPQVRGVKGEAVVIYCEPLTTKEMGYYRLSRRVNNTVKKPLFLEITLGCVFIEAYVLHQSLCLSCFTRITPCCLCNYRVNIIKRFQGCLLLFLQWLPVLEQSVSFQPQTGFACARRQLNLWLFEDLIIFFRLKMPSIANPGHLNIGIDWRFESSIQNLSYLLYR